MPQLHVSSIADPAKARVLRSYEKAHTDADSIDELASTLGITAPTVAMDSQAKYSVLAAGAAEILLRLMSPNHPDYREKIWDQAAGSIVVEEAGGRVTDLDGKPLDFSKGRTLAENRGVVATNGRLHDAVLEGLRDNRRVIAAGGSRRSHRLLPQRVRRPRSRRRRGRRLFG